VHPLHLPRNHVLTNAPSQANMASTNSLSSHLEDLRSRNPQSPPGEHVYTGYSTPTRYSGSFLNPNPQPARSDARGSLTRRMTADANLFNAFTSMTSQPGLTWDGPDMNASVGLPPHKRIGSRLMPDMIRLCTKFKRYVLWLEMRGERH
jgi:hypothetical protein